MTASEVMSKQLITINSDTSVRDATVVVEFAACILLLLLPGHFEVLASIFCRSNIRFFQQLSYDGSKS